MTATRARVVRGLAFTGALVTMLAFAAGPVIWMVSTALKPDPEIFAATPRVIPETPTLAHFSGLRVTHRQHLAVKSVRQHLDLPRKRRAVVLLEAPRGKLRKHLEQGATDHGGSGVACAALEPSVPAAHDEIGVGREHALLRELVEPPPESGSEKVGGVRRRAGH